MSTLLRIKKYIDYKGISIKKFEENVGFSNGSFGSQLRNNKTIGVDKLENILSFYPELSPEWLLTGRGEMLRPPEKNTAEEKRKETPAPNPADINIIVELSTRLGEQTNENKHLHHTNMELTAQIETLKNTIEELKAQLHEQKKQGKPYYSDTAPLSAVAEPDPPAVLKKTAKKAPLAPPNQGSSTIFGAKKI